METIVILFGSLFVPVVAVIAIHIQRTRARKVNQTIRKNDLELIETLENLVAIKSEHINKLR